MVAAAAVVVVVFKVYLEMGGTANTLSAMKLEGVRRTHLVMSQADAFSLPKSETSREVYAHIIKQ